MLNVNISVSRECCALNFSIYIPQTIGENVIPNSMFCDVFHSIANLTPRWDLDCDSAASIDATDYMYMPSVRHFGNWKIIYDHGGCNMFGCTCNVNPLWHLGPNIHAWWILTMRNIRFLHDRSWISPWIKSISNELDITIHMIASQLSGHCDIISNRLWRHKHNENRASETRGRCVKIVIFIVIYGFVMSCKK